MGRKRQEGPVAVGAQTVIVGSPLTPAGGHQFAPGNPYLVGLTPIVLGVVSAPGSGAPQVTAPSAPVEKGKHPITQDSWRLVKIEPEVQDLADHFGLDERIIGKLQEALDTRGAEAGTDLQAMWEILEEARNPPGLTMIKVKEMLDGTFRSGEKGDAGVKVLAEKFKLDERAAYKLSEVLATKPNKKDVLKALDTHLAASNNPSALVMLRLADLRKDVPLGEVPYGTKGYRDRPYLGSYDKEGRRIGREELSKSGPLAGEKAPTGDRGRDKTDRSDRTNERSDRTNDRSDRANDRGDRDRDRRGGERQDRGRSRNRSRSGGRRRRSRSRAGGG
eukprot:TRINITY_DN76760_c0_g1_i1.p1 TRINITY_DN76760_c0_g1~~TRINITY_DN76760_c0_g1_i1.p1  ORF type:complete len:333 (-),score=48.65 TRINITY_DN76760_c0_g1_i1:33-1031(-)